MKTTILCLPLLVLSTPAAVGADLPTPLEILEKAESATGQVKDYTALMIKQERFVDKMGTAERLQIKFARPFQVYIKFLNVFTGREVIFRKGWNDGEVRVHKGSFPDVTVNLDPNGDMAMEGNHHPVLDFGLENTIRVAARNLRKAVQRKEGDFSVIDGETYDGKPVWKILARFPKGGHNTQVQKGEDLWKIAARTGQDMYLILYANKHKGWDEADDPDSGDQVFIPRYYGARAEFLVDKASYLPLKVVTWDWDGKLYESFEYQNLKTNVGLTAKDFDPANPSYNF